MATTPNQLRIAFEHAQPGVAHELAVEWLTAHDVAIGAPAGFEPRGLMHRRADYSIGAWSSLGGTARGQLAGVLYFDLAAAVPVVRIAISWPPVPRISESADA